MFDFIWPMHAPRHPAMEVFPALESNTSTRKTGEKNKQMSIVKERNTLNENRKVE